MSNYEEQIQNLHKLKSAAKNQAGTTLRITKKIFQDEEFPHESFPTTRQKTRQQMILLTLCQQM